MTTVSPPILIICFVDKLSVYPGAKITLDDSFHKLYEDGGSMYVCVVLMTDIKRDVDFTLTTTDITAQGKEY